MHDPEYELPRISLPRTWVHRAVSMRRASWYGNMTLGALGTEHKEELTRYVRREQGARAPLFRGDLG
jgi:hypothetical protein